MYRVQETQRVNNDGFTQGDPAGAFFPTESFRPRVRDGNSVRPKGDGSLHYYFPVCRRTNREVWPAPGGKCDRILRGIDVLSRHKNTVVKRNLDELFRADRDGHGCGSERNATGWKIPHQDRDGPQMRGGSLPGGSEPVSHAQRRFHLYLL